MKDYYKILKLDRHATQEEINLRFLELAYEFHRDISIVENAHDIFIEINEAYQILSDNTQKSYYDSILNKQTESSEYDSDNEFDKFQIAARQNAMDNAKMDYRDYIKELDCFYSKNRKADGAPFYYYLHSVSGIRGGVGPMGSIKSKSIRVPIPRSKKAVNTHRLGFIIKLTFLIGAIVTFKIGYPIEFSIVLKLLLSIILLLGGGFATFVFYKIRGIESKHLQSENFVIVKKYKHKGFRRGAHPMVSTTPLGLIIYIFRWIL